MNVYCSFFKLLQWFFICIRITWGHVLVKLSLLHSPPLYLQVYETKICVSSRFPDTADAAVLGTPLWEPLSCQFKTPGSIMVGGLGEDGDHPELKV